MAVTAALLDLNVLTALLWPTHDHHEAAHRWFAGRGAAPWATCPLTQLGFIRLVSNPAFSRDSLSPAAAAEWLGENLAHPRHQFWPDSVAAPSAVKEMTLTGHQQLTDAYLLALAGHRRGVLATFDRGMLSLAGTALRAAVEVIALR